MAYLIYKVYLFDFVKQSSFGKTEQFTNLRNALDRAEWLALQYCQDEFPRCREMPTGWLFTTDCDFGSVVST